MADHDLNAVAFPALDDEQRAALGRCGAAAKKTFRDGETLFSAGQRDLKFFVVLEGEVEVVDCSGDAPRTIVVHGPGQFTGDISHLTGNAAVVSGVARGDCVVYEIAGDDLRRVIGQCPETGDLILNAFLARRQLLHEANAAHAFTGLRVIGSRYSQDTFRVREFLAKNRVLFTWLDVESDPDVDRLLRRFGLCESDTPVVACGDGKLLLKNPSDRDLADAIGLRKPPDESLYDFVIVGAGPAGLAAAVYAASEGLSTVVLDRTAPGGQAGGSMRIENYLGFPTGLTGAELVDRAVLQANKFGARLSIPAAVAGLEFDGRYIRVCLDDGTCATAKCLLVASGAEYRRLDAENCDKYEGRGVYYAATPNEANQCAGAEVVVVGGGNSAGQAAVFLASRAKRVTHVVRGGDLRKSMSSYLAHRIEHTPNIDLVCETTVGRMEGNGVLDAVELVNRKTGDRRTVPAAGLFSFIGATPRTGWLPPEVERDAKGFLLTGPAAGKSGRWPLGRTPFLLETTRPGIFAAGDVRAASVKRVASAVGEGSMAVQFVHEYLKDM